MLGFFVLLVPVLPGRRSAKVPPLLADIKKVSGTEVGLNDLPNIHQCQYARSSLTTHQSCGR